VMDCEVMVSLSVPFRVQRIDEGDKS
jgi:hypothetical protein